MINFLMDLELTNGEEELKRIKERQVQWIKIAKAQFRHLGRLKAEYPQNQELYYMEWKVG